MATVANGSETRDNIDLEAPACAPATRADYLDLEYHALMSAPEPESRDEALAFSRDVRPHTPDGGDGASIDRRTPWI